MRDESFVPFAAPDIAEAEIALVGEVLRSGWITTGPKVREFEAAFRDFLGADVEAVAVNSATAGLHLALEALGIGKGDEVIVPVHTFTATAAVIAHVGARPVFTDVRADTLTLDAEHVAAALTDRTRAIMPVHFAGRACDMPALASLAAAHDLPVVEDAAHALPTTCNGALIGTLDSAATVFSFYANKTITTGEGGMLVTRRPALAGRARQMRLHGISRDVFDRYHARNSNWYYEVIAPGFKYNMTDLAAAIGLGQLQRAWAMQKRRAEIARQYNEAFADLEVERPADSGPGDVHSWHLYCLRLPAGGPIGRDDFVEAMRGRGIGCSVHYIPLHLHPHWRDTYALDAGDYPNSTRAFAELVSLPIYSKMTAAAVDRVIASVRAILKPARRTVRPPGRDGGATAPGHPAATVPAVA